MKQVWGRMERNPTTLLGNEAIRRGDKGRWMVDDETHGVEISIAGGGEEIVRADPLGRFVFCLYHVLLVRYKNSRAALAMA